MSAPAKPRYLTVTLFDAPPLRIWTGDWPVIADVREEVQGWRNQMIVRQRGPISWDPQDMVLVSAAAKPLAGMEEDERERRGGTIAKASSMRMNDFAHIVEAIRSVALRMKFGDSFAQRCIAALPARKI